MSFGMCAIFRSVRFNVQTYGLFFALMKTTQPLKAKKSGLAYLSAESYIETMSGKKTYLLLLILLTLTTTLSAQEEVMKDDWKRIHMAGLAYDFSYKILEETTGDDTVDLKYRINSLGLNYSSFNGDRLGLLSDVSIFIPVSTSYGSDSARFNSGFTLDYTGSIAWRLQFSSFTLIPFAGFHADYSYLSEDPVDENKSNHMISVGLGTGIKGIYEISEGRGVFLGLRGSFNTLEFSSADYDSREIQLVRKFTVMLSTGYSWRPR